MAAQLHKQTLPVDLQDQENWSAYNEALNQRGFLTIWFDPYMAWVPQPTRK